MNTAIRIEYESPYHTLLINQSVSGCDGYHGRFVDDILRELVEPHQGSIAGDCEYLADRDMILHCYWIELPDYQPIKDILEEFDRLVSISENYRADHGK